MNKKQLTVAWGKKILAFILDIIIAYPLILILEFVILLFIFPFVAKEYHRLIQQVLSILLFIAYFFLLPNLTGNTFGRKILRIKDRYTALVISPLIHVLNKLTESREKFPQGYLKKNEILNVEVKDGR
jgi:hypothetical protein